MFVTFCSSCGFTLLIIISIILCGSGGTACLLVGLVPSVMFLFGQRLVVVKEIKIWTCVLVYYPYNSTTAYSESLTATMFWDFWMVRLIAMEGTKIIK